MTILLNIPIINLILYLNDLISLSFYHSKKIKNEKLQSLSARPSSIMWYIPFIQCGKQNFQIINGWKKEIIIDCFEKKKKEKIRSKQLEMLETFILVVVVVIYFRSLIAIETKKKKCFSLFRNGCVYFQGIFFLAKYHCHH